MENIKTESSKPTQRKTVFARCANKNTIRLEVEQPIRVEDIKRNIMKRFKYKNDNFTLFYQGMQIGQHQFLDSVKDNAIIHVVDLSSLQKSQIKVYFKDINSQKCLEAFVKPSDQIKSLVQKFLMQKIDKAISEVLLVYLGKVLNVNSTFAQEFVESQCEILITDVKYNKKSLNSFKTINKSHQVVIEHYQASIKLGMPYKENRSFADHETSKKKQIQKLEKKQNNKYSTSMSLKKIQEKYTENEEMSPQIDTKPNLELGIEEDMSYEIGKLAELKISESLNLQDLAKAQCPPLFKNNES